jgi:hypothetical protein
MLGPRIVHPETWRAIELIAACPTTSELPPESFNDYKLDMLVLMARAVTKSETPIY